MLKFIPPYLGDNIKSPAERKVFEILHNLQMNNAVIIHSLGLPKHESKIYGEMDFAIICEFGVACLEIKGGRVSYENGIWTFTNRNGISNSKSEGPFDQVIGGMFSLRNRITDNFKNVPKFKKMTYACGVIFSDIIFNHSGESIIPEIIFDSRYDDSEITGYIKRIFQYWKERNPRVTNNEQLLLSSKEIEMLKDYLRGDFSFIPSLMEQINVIDERLLRLTEEQYNVFEALSENDKIMIDGAAGTGKTMLAVEFAKRRALCGERVLLLTYNKNLAQALKAHENDSLSIWHFHGLASNYLDIKTISKEFFNEKLPEAFYEILSSGRIVKYDVLIIDEAQDLLRPAFIMCLDELIKGGLSSGKWCVFYDRAQNIYNEEFEQGMSLINSDGVIKYKLLYNCRNTKPIGLTNALLTHFPAAKVLKEDGENVDFVVYEDNKEFSEKLISLIKKYKYHSVNLSDITILSPVKYSESSISQITMLSKTCDINIVDGFEKSGVHYSTIQGFKGLESNIVILVDVDMINKSKFDSLLYTAISRAKVQLYIFCTNELKIFLDERYIDGVKKMITTGKIKMQ